MNLSIIVVQDNAEGKEIPVRLSQFLIGRDPQCHLRPASPLVSKRHCALLVRDGKAFLRDFDSTNGTMFNGQPLKGETELHNGDEFKVGPLCFRVKMKSPAAIKPPVKAAAVQKAPVAVPAGVAAGDADSDEDVFADLLMTLTDDDSGSSKTVFQEAETASASDSTVLQMSAATDTVTTKTDKVEEQPAPEEKTEAKKAEAKANTRSKQFGEQAQTSEAAKAILEKYMKRPRPFNK